MPSLGAPPRPQRLMAQPDGSDSPPPDDDQPKSGAYPVVSGDGPQHEEDPPPDDDTTKSGAYPVVSS